MPWRYGPFMALARGNFGQLPARWGRFRGILSFPAPPTYAAPTATSSGATVDPPSTDRDVLLPWRFR
jgi:hypothetical protein